MTLRGAWINGQFQGCSDRMGPGHLTAQKREGVLRKEREGGRNNITMTGISKGHRTQMTELAGPKSGKVEQENKAVLDHNLTDQ